jgi:hypothetical protein
MHRIKHRVNTRKELLSCPKELGVELDIRSKGKTLIIHHDPYIDGENFEEWIKYFDHGTLILNVKEEGLEERLIEIMKENDIEDYFFLDQSFPFIIKTCNAGESRCAVRISEFESFETAMSLAGKVQWVWVDCFNHFPLTGADSNRLKNEGGFKLCFVSPELHGRTNKEGVISFRKNIENLGIEGDAVCTKFPDLWQ